MDGQVKQTVMGMRWGPFKFVEYKSATVGI